MRELLQSKWDEILNFMKEEYNITEVSFKTWLKNLTVYDVDDNIAIISVQDSTLGENAVEFIKNKYSIYIKTAIAEVTGEELEISFIKQSEIDSQIKKEEEKKAAPASKRNLNPRYTFDNFVVGDNNNIAQASALAVAESPGSVYNPLFIYGGSGLGKTHLMYAISNFIQENNPDLKVLYVSSENFTNDYVNSLRSGSENPEQFRNKYRQNDVLLIDDIQFIIGRERTQEEFFHTFNEMKESNRQIVISSDRPPRELEILNERLKSRFEMGLTVDIQPPAYETRLAILNKKVSNENINLNEDILKYIAENVKRNIRELEGALTKVVAMGRLQKRSITLDLAKEALKDIISPDEKQSVNPQLVINVVAEHFDITTEMMNSGNRRKEIAYPRQIAMYLCRELCPEYSLNDIGKCLGGKHHTTILHGYNVVAEDITKDESLKKTIDIIIKKINPPE